MRQVKVETEVYSCYIPGSLLAGSSHTAWLGVSSPGQTQDEVVEESVSEEEPQTVAGEIVAGKPP